MRQHLLISSSEKQIFEIVLLCSVTLTKWEVKTEEEEIISQVRQACYSTELWAYWHATWQENITQTLTGLEGDLIFWDRIRWGTKHSAKSEELYTVQQKCLRMYSAVPSVGKSEKMTSVLFIFHCDSYLMIHLIIAVINLVTYLVFALSFRGFLQVLLFPQPVQRHAL